MGTAVLFAVIASAALPLGAALGVWRPPPRKVVAALLAFASGALITAVAFELFEEAFHGGEWQAALAFLGGATVFVLIDTRLERDNRTRALAGTAGGGVGFALLAGVTLDGVPENLAMGVSLIEDTNPALLVAIFVSNFPEATAGAVKMREAGVSRRKVMWIWIGAAVLLAIPVVLGYALLEGASAQALSWPLGFAAGAVLASLADTVIPEAYEEGGGPWVAWATAMGFLVSFVVSTL